MAEHPFGAPRLGERLEPYLGILKLLLFHRGKIYKHWDCRFIVAQMKYRGWKTAYYGFILNLPSCSDEHLDMSDKALHRSFDPTVCLYRIDGLGGTLIGAKSTCRTYSNDYNRYIRGGHWIYGYSFEPKIL